VKAVLIWTPTVKGAEKAQKHGAARFQVLLRMSVHNELPLLVWALCPLMSVLAFITFALIRLFIGYQIVFAECRKPDLGGRFWVAALQHQRLAARADELSVLQPGSRVPVPGLVCAPHHDTLYVGDHVVAVISVVQHYGAQPRGRHTGHLSPHRSDGGVPQQLPRPQPGAVNQDIAAPRQLRHPGYMLDDHLATCSLEL